MNPNNLQVNWQEALNRLAHLEKTGFTLFGVYMASVAIIVSNLQGIKSEGNSIFAVLILISISIATLHLFCITVTYVRVIKYYETNSNNSLSLYLMSRKYNNFLFPFTLGFTGLIPLVITSGVILALLNSLKLWEWLLLALYIIFYLSAAVSSVITLFYQNGSQP